MELVAKVSPPSWGRPDEIPWGQVKVDNMVGVEDGKKI